MSESQDQELLLEIQYKRGWNMGKFGDLKEYTIKMVGNQSVVEDQLKNHKKRLTKYITEVEDLVELAHKTNIARVEAEKTIAVAALAENKPSE